MGMRAESQVPKTYIAESAISLQTASDQMIEYAIERSIEDRSVAFEKLLEETMRNSIRDLLGESSMKAILFHVNLERVASDPEVFHQRLFGILNTSASIIEEVIIKDLFKRLDLLYSPPRKAFEFAKYVGAAREYYLSKGKKT